MYEYHVLSNYDFVKILVYAICGMVILRAFAAYLGRRDGRIAEQKKSVFRKVVPWGLLCILFSESSLLIYRLLYYPWSTVPQPSQTSIVKEMQYGADSIILWGWANDSQLTVLSSFAGTALWLFWTIYAFKYMPSDTSKWKKFCKILTYIIISVSILGFNIHSFLDFVWWTIGFIIVIVLLRISSVKKILQEDKRKDVSIDNQVRIKKIIEKQDIESSENIKKNMPKISKRQEANESIYDRDVNEYANKPIKVEPLSFKEVKSKMSIIDGSEAINELNNKQENEILDNNLMFCKYCGKRIEADSLFCKYCGKKI